jgi:hypothetical protein
MLFLLLVNQNLRSKWDSHFLNDVDDEHNIIEVDVIPKIAACVYSNYK